MILDRLPDRLFEAALAASVALHGLAWGAAGALLRAGPSGTFPAVEVDLSAPFRPRSPFDTRPPGAARGAQAPAPKRVSGGTGPKAPPSAEPPLEAPTKPAPPSPPKEWVLPGPNTQVLEKPVIPSAPAEPQGPVGAAPVGAGAGGEGGRGGSGGGAGTGDALVNRPPRLVNVSEIRASLRRFYPESERRAGREGRVILGLEIGADGRVLSVEVLESAGSAFDGAAKAVARKMLFEPALARSVPTAARVRQAVVFRLSD